MNLIILRILGLAHIIAVNVNIASACYFAALSFCLERLFGQSCCCMCLNIRGCFLQIKNLQRNIFALIPGFPNILLGQALNVIIQSCMNHSVCCLLVLWQYSGQSGSAHSPCYSAVLYLRPEALISCDTHSCHCSVSSWSRWLLLLGRTCFIIAPYMYFNTEIMLCCILWRRMSVENI